MKNTIMLIVAALVVSLGAEQAAAETPWLGVVFAQGELKEQIESTPIELRPNRPLHFYGNSVRRKYYRGNGWPQGRDLARTVGAMVTKRPESVSKPINGLPK